MPRNIAVEVIGTKIIELRGKKVMLDKDLARLYGVPVKVLNQAVKRNKGRFPEDFMFQLSWGESESLRSQIVTLNNLKSEASKRGRHIKYLPYAFSEHGVAMLSSVLNSERAIQINILIMRAFTKLRDILLTHKELAAKVESLEKKYTEHDRTIRGIFEAIKKLLEPPPPERKRIIGFCVHRKQNK